MENTFSSFPEKDLERLRGSELGKITCVVSYYKRLCGCAAMFALWEVLTMKHEGQVEDEVYSILCSGKLGTVHTEI